jgi:acetyl esterase/lipase
MKIKLGLLLIIQFGITFISNAQINVPSSYSVKRDVVYKQENGWKGNVDLYVPKKGKGNRPLVIFIHGGGWVHGKKEQETDFQVFFEKNFVVANVEYRVASQAVAPAAIEDSRCALNFLINQASAYKIDRNKIVVMGVSAGAHLALMVGFTAADAAFASGCQPLSQKKFKVAGIIDISGPTDLAKWETLKKPGKASRDWLGSRVADSGFVKSLSAVTYVRPSSPPVLIVHGKKDRTVPFEQAEMLFETLQKAGVPTQLKSIEHAGHAFSKSDKAVLKEEIFAFLKRINID